MTPQEPAMGVSDEAVRAAQGKMIAQITNPEAWPPGYADGFNDAAKLCFEEIPAALLAALPHMRPAGATQPAPVDVRVVDEPMVVRALNAMVPGSDLGDAFGRWNVASFIACNEAPFTEVSRHDVMRAALKAALLSAQPSADAGDCLRDAIVGVVLAHKDDDEIDPDAFVDELLAAIAAQREAQSA